jgi:hypothetical protein
VLLCNLLVRTIRVTILNIYTILIAVCVIIGAVIYFIYNCKKAIPLPRQCPRLAWFPKYDLSIQCPIDLTERLAELGYFPKLRNSHSTLFYRRTRIGFSESSFPSYIELVRQEQKTRFIFGVRWGCLLDIGGGTWKLATKLRHRLEIECSDSHFGTGASG